MPAPWSEFELDAPALAQAIRARFESNLHHVIGTIRPSGAPRLSGTEVHIVDGELTLGMMADSFKLADVLRDPRVEIHAAPLVSGSDTNDAKIAGELVATGPTRGPAGSAFRLAITIASQVRVEGSELVLTTWRPGRGVRELRRS